MSERPPPSAEQMQNVDPSTCEWFITAIRSTPKTIEDARQKYALLRAVAEMIPLVPPGAALVYQSILVDLEAISAAQPAGNEMLSYDEAALYSGYSKKQLARLAEQGVVTTVGKNRNRRFLRSSLPTKPGHHPPAPPDSQPQLARDQDDRYDASADARELRARLDLAS